MLFVLIYIKIMYNHHSIKYNLNCLLNNFKLRSIDMGIKLNPCSYEIVEYIKKNRNIQMFKDLIKLIDDLNFNIRVQMMMILLKQSFNKPIVYGFKHSNDSKLGIEFYLYIGDHNQTHSRLAADYVSKAKLIESVYMNISKLYSVRPFYKSDKLHQLISKLNLFIVSFNIDKDGNLEPGINLYTEAVIKKNNKSQIVILTFVYNINTDTLNFSNLGTPFASKNAMATSDIIKNNKFTNNKFTNNLIKKIPDGSRYIFHIKQEDIFNIYIVHPKINDVNNFLITHKYNPAIINYFKKYAKHKSVDIAYGIKNNTIARTALYDVF